MKREAVNHHKMKRLCRQLDLPTYQAVGILESLWHLTARERPQGDVGKLSNEDIALGIDYRGDETLLIDALVKCGWLDTHPKHRLIVHDWADHADDAVQMRLARARQYFADGRAPKLTRLPGEERRKAHEFYFGAHAVCTESAQNRQSCVPPEPEPEPEPEPDLSAGRHNNNTDENRKPSSDRRHVDPSTEELDAVRGFLHEYVKHFRLPWPAPDDDICRRVLRSAGGDPNVLHQYLVYLAKKRNQAPSISYGWFERVIANLAKGEARR